MVETLEPIIAKTVCIMAHEGCKGSDDSRRQELCLRRYDMYKACPYLEVSRAVLNRVEGAQDKNG